MSSLRSELRISVESSNARDDLATINADPLSPRSAVPTRPCRPRTSVAVRVPELVARPRGGGGEAVRPVGRWRRLSRPSRPTGRRRAAVFRSCPVRAGTRGPGGRPGARPPGESIRLLESAEFIWKAIRSSNSRKRRLRDPAGEVAVGIAPDDRVHADGRAVFEDVGQLGAGLGASGFVGAAEAEFILLVPQVAEAAEIGEEHKDRRMVFARFLFASADFGGNRARRWRPLRAGRPGRRGAAAARRSASSASFLRRRSRRRRARRTARATGRPDRTDGSGRPA